MLWVAGFILLLGLASACSTNERGLVRVDLIRISALEIRPARIAVLVPPTNDPSLAHAYAHLETMTGHLLREALGSRVVERGDLTPIHSEQRRQYAEPASEETTTRLGRISGADTLVVYRIISPTLRERLFAPEGTLPPITIIGKMLRVETGEVLWNHLVSVEMRPMNRWRGAGFDSDPIVRQALDRGVKAMEAALNQAVRCVNSDCLTESPALPYSTMTGHMAPAATR